MCRACSCAFGLCFLRAWPCRSELLELHLVEGSLHLVDAIRMYRRKTLVERTIKVSSHVRGLGRSSRRGQYLQSMIAPGAIWATDEDAQTLGGEAPHWYVCQREKAG